MAVSTLVLTGEDQIPALIRKGRREFKEFAEGSVTARAVVDEVVELSVDDTPLREWPGGSAVVFVSELCGLAQTTIETESEPLSKDPGRQDLLKRLSDLLISFVVAVPGSFDSSMRERLCRLWVCSRLAAGLEQDPQVFIDCAVAALETIGLDSLKLVAQVQSEVFNHLTRQRSVPILSPRPASDGGSIAAPTLALTSEDQIPALVRKSRRELKELAKSSATARAVVDEVVELSVDDTPFREWPRGSAALFVSELCRSTQAMIETDSATSSPDNGRQDSLMRLSDLLISFVIALPGSFDSSMRERLCRLWVCSRLAAGLDQDPQVFIDGAVAALETIGLDRLKLVAQVRAEVLNDLTKQTSAPILPSRPASNGPLGTPTQPKHEAPVAKPEPLPDALLS